MENVNDLQLRAFYERLKALSDGGVVVNGLMIVSLSKFEDLLEAYRTYFFDAISDFDDESYHYDSVNFDDLQHKLDNLSNDVKDLDKSLSSDDDSDEPEDDVVEEAEPVDSDEDPVVANAFGVKKDADDESEKEDLKDDVNSYSDAVDEKISDSLVDSMNFEVKAQSESQLEDTYGENVVNSLKSENESFSASKNFDGRFDKVMSSMSKSDADDVVKSSAEVVASDSVLSQESLESLDDIDVPANSMNDGDIYADSIHVTSNDNDDLNEDEVMDESDSSLDALVDGLNELPSDSNSDDEDQ